MTAFGDPGLPGLLLMVAGAKGAVGSTLAVAVATLGVNPDLVLASLTTADKFPGLGLPQATRMVGWDTSTRSLPDSIKHHGVLPGKTWMGCLERLTEIPVREAPRPDIPLKTRVIRLAEDMDAFRSMYPRCRPVFINLLPASVRFDSGDCRSLHDLYARRIRNEPQDIAYVAAAIESGVPVVNFTSNEVEIPAIQRAAMGSRVPLCGRDGKSGQTYLKVVLASALKARSLYVDGWYSMNILGNADGENLVEPGRADAKLSNKTELLDEVLGYHVGERYGSSSHKVRIDYYPPRGDAKEAWDVIDFMGLFGLPMSLRLNLLGRDSILAAPMVLDLARWMAVLKEAGRMGPVPELAFFFKKPLGEGVPLSFQDQLHSLDQLERSCGST